MNNKCGTYGGYQAHGQRGEERCDACKEASRRYQSQRRKTYPRAQAAEKAKEYARDRALRKLARLHPAEFRVLYDAELATLPDPFPAITAARKAAS